MRATSTARLTAALVITAATAAGCTGEDPDPSPGSQPPSAAPSVPAAPSVAPAVAAASDEVLNRYRGFRAAYTQAGLTADAQNKELLSYLEAPLKQNVIAFLTQTKQNSAVYRGEAESDPTVVKVDLGAKTPTALVSDCFDATNYRLYYTKTDKPVPIKSGPRRYIIETTAMDFGRRGWLFTKSASFPERSC